MNNKNNYRELATAICKLAIKDKDFDFFNSDWFNNVIIFFVDERIIDYVNKINEREKIKKIGYECSKELIDDDFIKTFNLIKNIKL